jgi:hypothetical protein
MLRFLWEHDKTALGFMFGSHAWLDDGVLDRFLAPILATHSVGLHRQARNGGNRSGVGARREVTFSDSRDYVKGNVEGGHGLANCGAKNARRRGRLAGSVAPADFYSCRSAVAGSIAAARRAGRKLAIIAIAMSPKAAPPISLGSDGVIP